MMKISLLVCLVSGCLAQWIDPNRSNARIQDKYPQLAGSYPVFKYPEDYNIELDVTTSTGAPTLATTTAPTTTTTPAPEQCTGIFSCADCNTAQVCRPSATGFVRAYTLPCPTSAPYCDASSGTCTTVPDSKCGSTDNFFCTQNGYFPDPTDCSVYHTCNDYQAKKFKCADQQSYDPEKAECRSGAPCNYTVNCTNESEVKLEMADTHYFAYCSKGTPLLVTRCQGEYKLNTTSQVCEPLCEKDGLMADEEDCTKFYQCSTWYIKADLSVRIRKNLSCPTGEAFEPTSYQCISKESSSCKK